jgi:hypothetical protein
MEMSSAQSGEPSNCWVCQECALVSTQRDEASFYRHLEMIHNLKQKEKDMESEVFARWRDDLVKRAFSHERCVFTPLDGFRRLLRLDLYPGHGLYE